MDHVKRQASSIRQTWIRLHGSRQGPQAGTATDLLSGMPARTQRHPRRVPAPRLDAEMGSGPVQALLLKLSGAMAHMSGEALEETSPRKIRASQSLHQVRRSLP